MFLSNWVAATPDISGRRALASLESTSAADLRIPPQVTGDPSEPLIVPLIVRDVVLDLGAADGETTEFVLGDGRGLMFAAPVDGFYTFVAFQTPELIPLLAGLIAAGVRPNDGRLPETLNDWHVSLASVLGRPVAEVPPPVAQIPIRVSTAAGVVKDFVVYHHGTAFAWVDPGDSPRIAWAESVDQLEEVIADALARMGVKL